MGKIVLWMLPIHNYLGALGSHNAVPGDKLQIWGQHLGQGQ